MVERLPTRDREGNMAEKSIRKETKAPKKSIKERKEAKRAKKASPDTRQA
jgi:hypothetical protein